MLKIDGFPGEQCTHGRPCYAPNMACCMIFLLCSDKQSLRGVRGWGEPLVEDRGLEVYTERKQEVIRRDRDRILAPLD